MVTAAKLPETASLPLGAGMVESRVRIAVKNKIKFSAKYIFYISKCAKCTDR